MTPTPTTPITHTGGATGHGTAATTTAPPAARRFRSVRALRAGPVSLRVHPRSLLIGVILLVAVAVTAAAHLAVGGGRLGATHLFNGMPPLLSREPGPVGACLAAAGAITQTVARNPLASPDILGVTAGASAGAVAVLILAEDGAAGLSGLAATVGMPVAAFTAGLISGVAAYLLAYRNGIDSYRLILVGLGISGFATALTTSNPSPRGSRAKFSAVISVPASPPTRRGPRPLIPPLAPHRPCAGAGGAGHVHR